MVIYLFIILFYFFILWHCVIWYVNFYFKKIYIFFFLGGGGISVLSDWSCDLLNHHVISQIQMLLALLFAWHWKWSTCDRNVCLVFIQYIAQYAFISLVTRWCLRVCRRSSLFGNVFWSAQLRWIILKARWVSGCFSVFTKKNIWS